MFKASARGPQARPHQLLGVPASDYRTNFESIEYSIYFRKTAFIIVVTCQYTVQNVVTNCELRQPYSSATIFKAGTVQQAVGMKNSRAATTEKQSCLLMFGLLLVIILTAVPVLQEMRRGLL